MEKNEFEKIVITKKEFDIQHKYFQDRKIYKFEVQKKFMESRGLEFKAINANLFDSSALTPCSLIALFSNEKINLKLKKFEKNNKDKYKLAGFYMKMITSHLAILEDFEFYNVALITKYFLEANAGIMANKDNLDDYFKDMNYNEYKKRKKKYNGSISQNIKKNLGEDCHYIYTNVNAFAHPFYGPTYGLKPILQTKRNIEIIAWLTKSYEICFIKVFKILEIDINIDFIKEIYIEQSILFKEAINDLPSNKQI